MEITTYLESFGLDKKTWLQVVLSNSFVYSELSEEQAEPVLRFAAIHNLNPFTSEIRLGLNDMGFVYPIVGLNAIRRYISEDSAIEGVEYRYSDERVDYLGSGRKVSEWVECLIFRKGNSKPISSGRLYLEEEAYDVEHWVQSPVRNLKGKALREAFGLCSSMGVISEEKTERKPELNVQKTTHPEVEQDEPDLSGVDVVFNAEDAPRELVEVNGHPLDASELQPVDDVSEGALSEYREMESQEVLHSELTPLEIEGPIATDDQVPSRIRNYINLSIGESRNPAELVQNIGNALNQLELGKCLTEPVKNWVFLQYNNHIQHLEEAA